MSDQSADQSPERAALIQRLDLFCRALAERDASRLTLAKGLRITENGQTLSFGEGLWATAGGPVDHIHDFADPATGQAGTIARAIENDHPVVLSLRLRFEGAAIREIEMIVARPTEMLFVPDNVPMPRERLLVAVEPEKRRSRAELVDIANRYFEGLRNNDGARLLVDDHCQRHENGLRATNNPDRDGAIFHMTVREQFDTGFAAMITNVRDCRHLIVDEEAQLVFSSVIFEHAADERFITYRDGSVHEISGLYAQPMGFLIGELFKIVDGRIHEIEAVLLTIPFGMPSGWAPAEGAAQ
ncbi:MAG TPA: hypothetical protein VNZ43_15355 [Sphingomonadaceae bacterium]|nr:hypothetical protein [Sphingomonadaceae bacterium]